MLCDEFFLYLHSIHVLCNLSIPNFMIREYSCKIADFRSLLRHFICGIPIERPLWLWHNTQYGLPATDNPRPPSHSHQRHSGVSPLEAA